MTSLESFHPELQAWFTKHIGQPTDIQEEGWPLILQSKHLLITAATGSGKTLAAFYSILDRFAQLTLATGATRVLYVSPLKALNNDVQKNLLKPVEALSASAGSTASMFRSLSIGVRSGDTLPSERQRMLRHPPEILITTPESLQLLLTNVRGRLALASVEVAIVDEIHALMENRRGVQLMTCLERLVEIAGEFQRIGLSATVSPAETAASYVGGYLPSRQARSVSVIRSQQSKRYDFTARYPQRLTQTRQAGDDYWGCLCEEVRKIIEARNSTLVFTNSRRLAERVTLELNRGAGKTLAYSHHGSLSREVRNEVERRLKSGELQAIVATSSLELGIDIGDLDEVVLVGSPPSITSTLQRIGRAGHQVGSITSASLFPTHSRDCVGAAVLMRAVKQMDIEPISPIRGPLDLLAQVLVSMSISETWKCEGAFRCLTRSWPYADLSRAHFEIVLEMLAGRYEHVRIRNLRPRIVLDRAAQSFTARKGAAFALYSAGGTIPDRGYFQLKHARSGAKLGELDEEFVWEARVGSAFTFGTKPWKIERITNNDVEVVPAPERTVAPPFWRAESQLSSHHIGRLTGEFLEAADRLLQRDCSKFRDSLRETGFDETSAKELCEFLAGQREITRAPLPSCRHVLVEHLLSGPGGVRTGEQEEQLVIHATWGGRVNRPIAIALRSSWKRAFGWDPEIYSNNHCIVAQLREGISAEKVVQLLEPSAFESDLRDSLEQSEYFGARFRECAGRALLLSKGGFNRRTPLWMSRLNAKRLMSATAHKSDFPITLETWRTCLADEFDLRAALEVLRGIHSREIEISIWHTRKPSPFAADLTFSHVSHHMYATDQLGQEVTTALDSDLLAQVVATSSLRPAIKPETIRFFEERTQRRAPDYEPNDERELSEWVKERVWIPIREWFVDTPLPSGIEVLQIGQEKWLVHPEVRSSTSTPIVAQIESALQFYGPKTYAQLTSLFPVAEPDLAEAIGLLRQDGTILADIEVKDSPHPHSCDSENFEALLRLQRIQQRATTVPLPLDEFPGFLARRHGVGEVKGSEPYAHHLDRLRDYVAPVDFWCDIAWRTRVEAPGLPLLDTAIATLGMEWRGSGNERIALCFNGEPRNGSSAELDVFLNAAFPDPSAHYKYSQIAQNAGLERETLNQLFWTAVWRGSISSEGLAPLENARKREFTLRNIESPSSTGRHSLATRRRPEPGWNGLWKFNQAPSAVDPLSRLENQKERARVLLDRYGVLTKELANREGGDLRWQQLFSALRLMELGGEVVSGEFVDGLSSPQFMTPWEVGELHRPRNATPFWISAWDPISPTGLGGTWSGLPPRRLTTFLGFISDKLSAWVTGAGHTLNILDDTDKSSLEVLLTALQSQVSPTSAIRIETINGNPASKSEYLGVLRDSLSGYLDQTGFVVERTKL